MEERPEAAPRPPPAEHKREQEAGEALHVAKRRKVLCSEFAAITSSDEAVARRFLAGSDWHMERALNTYFDPPRDTEAAAGGAAPACADTGTCIDLTTDATTSNAGVNSEDSQQKEDNSNFSLITWNIDGLDLGNVKDRARGICTYLALYSPDVVFLQEVIPPHLPLLQMKAGNYTIIPGNIDGYFTAVMLKKSRVKLLKHEIIPFPTTAMKRNLLIVHVSISGIELCLMTSHLESTKDHSKEHIKQLEIVLNEMQKESESTTVIFGGDTKPLFFNVSISGIELCLMTSHLESTKDHSKERIKQLKIVLNEMQKESESTTVIFGGDTNLRDSEVAKLGNLPDNIKDAWEFLGRPQNCRYTWDTQSNTNLNAAYKCKMRFDRIYFRPAVEGGHFIPRSMDLIGLEKLECGRFPSDHWGILCNFDVIL